MREVADLAGVAMSSVSRVLSGHPDVSPAMQQRVMAAVDSLGYQPDLLAQSLRRRETLSIGLVLGDLSDPPQAQIALGAERVLRARSYALLLASSEHEPALDTDHIRGFPAASRRRPAAVARGRGRPADARAAGRGRDPDRADRPRAARRRRHARRAPSCPTTAPACATPSATCSTSATAASA